MLNPQTQKLKAYYMGGGKTSTFCNSMLHWTMYLDPKDWFSLAKETTEAMEATERTESTEAKKRKFRIARRLRYSGK